MKVRHWAGLACVAGMALVLVSCGKKEESAENKAAPAAQPAAAPVDAATAGSVSGAVKFVGAVPKAKTLNMAADAACAGAHSGPVSDLEVVANASGDLANVIVYVKDGLGNRAFEAPKDGAQLNQEGCMYTPHIVGMMAGQTLSVKNSDKTTHNIHPVPKNNREWNKSQPPGSPNINEVFARDEVAIPVKCNVHPWMKSYIAVFKHPYFAVTDAKGSFEIKNLPPGTYTIEAWHERFGTVSQSVTVGAKEAKTVAFSFKPDSGD
jgi:plastocyanin